VGRLVGYCIEKDKELPSLTIGEFRHFHEGFREDVYDRLTVESSINARNIPGGTSKEMVLRRIAEIEEKKS
jgi:argininosuccinate lyase